MFTFSYMKAQIFEGKVAEYSERYDMSEIESYSRINANGGLFYNRKGFISFKPNEIIVGIGKSNDTKEIYMELDFQNDYLKNSASFSQLFTIVPRFIMKNAEEKQIVIEYFTLESFKKMTGGQFVISIDNKMYILQIEKNILEAVSDLYRN